MAHGYYDVATRWCDVALGRSDKLLRNERMMPSYDGDELYSYGSHFTLVQRLKDKRGNTVAFLLNGDTYSVTTSGHQSHVRAAVQRTGLPSVIIPFSALDAADIDRDTVEIVDVLPDRIEEKRHTFTEMQPSWQWRNDPVYSYRDYTVEELQKMANEKNKRGREEHHYHVQWALEAAFGADDVPDWRRNLYEEYLPGGPRYERAEVTIEDVLTSLESSWQGPKKRFVECTYPVLYQSGRKGARTVHVEYVGGEPIEYWYETSRHWLGESLIRAKVHYTKLHRCTDCAGFGTHPYAPETPVGSWLGRYDPDDEWERDRLIEWAQRSAGCRTCNGRGRVATRHRRTAQFLSGFDHNETRNLYFFSELPTTKSTTVEQAYEELKPDTVKIAEQMGREVSRQGDIFAVPMPDLDKRTLRQMGATFEKRGVLLGTNHVATEVARLKDGQTLARGTLTHDPGWRRPDHKRVSLPRGVWHLTVKNTVPIGR